MRGNCTALMSQPKILGTGPKDKDIVGTSSIAKQSLGHGPPKPGLGKLAHYLHLWRRRNY